MDAAVIGAIAGTLALTQAIPFIISIFRGHTRPERATYAIWSTVNIILLLSYVAAGATSTAGVAIAYALTTLFVFVISIKKGAGGFNHFDIACMALALVGVVLWVNTSNPVYALYFSILVKALGLLPTVVKAYYRPDSENKLSWAMCAAASILNMFAITSLDPHIISFPLYALIGDVTLAVLVLFPKFRPRRGFRKQARLYSARNF